ncbi:MAG: long-chain fatty acid--CoA ligase [Proteobacteria bacterium]|nr:long-chain fatty acid--CoA ligase [Pseudomonadota bacterium]
MIERPTLLHHLFAHAQQQHDVAALRYKAKGTWHDITWEGYKQRVLVAGAGLRTLGLQPGDMAAVLSTNRTEWLVGDLACLAIGCPTVPIYPSSIAPQVQYILEHSGCKAVIAEDAGQLHKLLEIRDACPNLEHIIVLEGDDASNQDGVVAWADLIKRGDDAGPEAWASVEAQVEANDPAALATIVYTSGTTGPPKGAMISHRNMMAMAESLAAALEAGDNDSSLSFLPLSHIAERLQGEIMAIRVGYTVNMGEGLEHVAANLVETEPTILVCVPRLWEKYYSRITSGLQDAPDLRKKLFGWATDVGKALAHQRSLGNKPSVTLKMQYDVADRLVLSKVRKKLGMARGRRFISGAAPLSADVGVFFAGLGISIQEVYGQTECVGVCTFNPLDKPKYGTVGIPVEGQEIKIAEDGEILVKGDNVFMGYLKQPEATAETIVDGWLHTGDVGEFDAGGYVKITDRKKDIIVTAGGKNVSPQNIENRLKQYAGMSQVVVVGDKRKFLSALVTLDEEGLEELYDRDDRKVPPADARPTDDGIRALLQGYIDEVNGGLASYETLKKFVILPEDFTVESGELTPSLKVKRRVIQRTHEALIDSFYSEKFA